MSDNVILFVAQKAVIVHLDKVLILREANSYKDSTNVGKWGVPGGRIKPGEHIVSALKREVYEETGLEIEVGVPVHVDEWFPKVRDEDWHIVATFRLCKIAGEDKVILSEEHDLFEWISEEEVDNYSLMAEDVKAIREYFHQHHGTRE